MIEENDERKLLLKRRTFAPVAFGARVFSPAQLKMSILCKEFLAKNHSSLDKQSHPMVHYDTDSCANRQPIRDKILSNQDNDTFLME